MTTVADSSSRCQQQEAAAGGSSRSQQQEAAAGGSSLHSTRALDCRMVQKAAKPS